MLKTKRCDTLIGIVKKSDEKKHFNHRRSRFHWIKNCKKFLSKKYNVFGVDDLSTGKYTNIPKGVKFIKEIYQIRK